MECEPQNILFLPQYIFEIESCLDYVVTNRSEKKQGQKHILYPDTGKRLYFRTGIEHNLFLKPS